MWIQLFEAMDGSQSQTAERKNKRRILIMDILMAKVTHWIMFAVAIWKLNFIKGHMGLVELITKR